MYQMNAVGVSQGASFLPLHLLSGPVDIGRSFPLSKKDLAHHTHRDSNPQSTKLHADQNDSHFLV